MVFEKKLLKKKTIVRFPCGGQGQDQDHARGDDCASTLEKAREGGVVIAEHRRGRSITLTIWRRRTRYESDCGLTNKRRS